MNNPPPNIENCTKEDLREWNRNLINTHTHTDEIITDYCFMRYFHQYGN